MAIITAGDLSDLYNQNPFRANGSTVTLKKVSETDWMLIGDLAEGDSVGFGGLEPTPEGFVIKTTDGVVAVVEGPGEVAGTDVYVEVDGYIYGKYQLEEVLSWPEEKPVWLEGDGVIFFDAQHLTKVPDTLSTWITNTSYMFYGCSNFDQDLSGWDTSNVTDMSYMFQGCSNFNQDLSGWNISNVTNMTHMFDYCPSFDQDLSGWDTSNVTNMSHMFQGCSDFDQDLSWWDTSSVTDMSYMFQGCSNFNQDLSGWCVSNISSEPFGFSDSTTSWTLPKPIWGTCP